MIELNVWGAWSKKKQPKDVCELMLLLFGARIERKVKASVLLKVVHRTFGAETIDKSVWMNEGALSLTHKVAVWVFRVVNKKETRCKQSARCVCVCGRSLIFLLW